MTPDSGLEFIATPNTISSDCFGRDSCRREPGSSSGLKEALGPPLAPLTLREDLSFRADFLTFFLAGDAARVVFGIASHRQATHATRAERGTQQMERGVAVGQMVSLEFLWGDVCK